MFQSCLTRSIIVVTLACSLPGPSIASDGASGPVEAVPFTLTLSSSRANPKLIEGELELSERGKHWRPTVNTASPFAKIWHLRGSWRDDGKLESTLEYECQGPEEPARRFCFETRALDKHGKLLAHNWQVEGDNRIGPAEIPLGSLIALRSRLNSTNNRLSGPALRSVARLDFRLTEMPNGLPRHFPSAPQKLNLQVTRSDKCGRFEVSFANPAGWNLDPAKHQIAFQLFVRDKNDKLVRADRHFLAYRADGRYRECVRVEPIYYDHSEVSVTVFTRQPDNDKFIGDFFFGGGSGYRGVWTGDGGPLAQLPLKDHQLFDDLPPSR